MQDVLRELHPMRGRWRSITGPPWKACILRETGNMFAGWARKIAVLAFCFAALSSSSADTKRTRKQLIAVAQKRRAERTNTARLSQ
jgi:hypothetical protein